MLIVVIVVDHIVQVHIQPVLVLQLPVPRVICIAPIIVTILIVVVGVHAGARVLSKFWLLAAPAIHREGPKDTVGVGALVVAIVIVILDRLPQRSLVRGFGLVVQES